MAEIPVHHYVYGKIVGTTGGPVEAGFEHKITRVTRDFPADVLKFCDPIRRIDDTRLKSTRALVHPLAQRHGAFFLLPVHAGDQRYMSASRVRARSEAGETATEIIPGRTYTQYDLYLFHETIWAEHAPWLLATIPRRLRTDPTLWRDFKEEREVPEERRPVGPDRFPFHRNTALPGAESKVWNMLDALESIEVPGVFGPATGFPHEKDFCSELAHAAALLPPQLRIYLTVAGNAAAIQGDCAIQFIPGESDGLPELPGTSGFFSQLAAERKDQDIDSWHARLNNEHALEKRFEDPCSTPEKTRHRLAEILTEFSDERSLDALESYLTGRAPRPPREPTQREIKARWLTRLDDYLWQIAQGKPITEITQGRPAEELPERAVELTAGLTGAEWANTWRLAFEQLDSDPEHQNRLLAWSALRSNTEGDDDVVLEPAQEAWALLHPNIERKGIPVGELPDFQSLKQIWDLLRNYRSHRSKDISEDSDPLSKQGILVRMKRLPGRTPRILADNPFELLPLADLDEFGHGFLASERDDRGRKELRSETEATLTYVYHAARLLEKEPPTTLDRQSEDFSRLAEAAEVILNVSFPDWQERDSRIPIWRTYLGYLECRLRTHEEPGQAFWQAAFEYSLYEQAGDKGLEHVWQTLFALVDNYTYEPSRESELHACFDQVLTHLVQQTQDKAHLLATMLKACESHGPESLIPATTPQHIKDVWAQRLQDLLFNTLPDLEPNTVLGELTSKVASLCRAFSAGDSRQLKFCIHLIECMLERLARCGAEGRKGTLRLLRSIERLLFNFGWNPKNPSPLLDVERLDNRLRECILSWAEGDKPYLIPFSSDPQEWKTDINKLRQEPLRYHLAHLLGNPYCVYYGHITAEIRNGPNTRAGDFQYSDDPRRNLLVARCAIMEWKTRFELGIKHKKTQYHTELESFLTVEKYGCVIEDVLKAIGSIVRLGDTRYLEEFGWDLVYAVELLDAIDPATNYNDGYIMHPDDVRKGSTPEEMHAALIVDTVENFDRTCFGAFLASVMVIKNLGLGKGFHRFLHSDPKTARHRFLRHILGRPNSWEAFDTLSPEQIAQRLDRILFLLHLWAQVTPELKKSSEYSPTESSAVFALPDGPRDTVARSLEANPDYLDTFKRLFGRIGIDCPPGWPIE